MNDKEQEEIRDMVSGKKSVVVLAAGSSRRMGHPKYAMHFSEEQTFLSHILEVYYRAGINRQIVVTGAGFDPVPARLPGREISVLENLNLRRGRSWSIRLGLEQTEGAVFIQNIDNPFVNPGLVMQMMTFLADYDYVVPAYQGQGGHPVLLSEKAVAFLKDQLSSRKPLNILLRELNRGVLKVEDPYVTANINTRSDYLSYFGDFIFSDF
ncbi:MAG: nucleotidyltransferase family protein [Bacteroidales bacterium]